MKLQVRTKQIELVPTMCKEAEVKFIFRQPTQVDYMNMAMVKSSNAIVAFMDSLLVEIKGELVLEDEDGKEHKPKTLNELFGFGGEELTPILNDIVVKFGEIAKGISAVEKK